MGAKSFFSNQEQLRIVEAVKQAELNTSGEIRVHLESKCKENVLDHAAFIFEQLAMHKTELRNGVLIYIAVDSHKFAIIGDAGINQVVPGDFWESTKSLMLGHFKEGRFCDGLCEGILKSGEQLKSHFPYKQDDINELSDEISFGS